MAAKKVTKPAAKPAEPTAVVEEAVQPIVADAPEPAKEVSLVPPGAEYNDAELGRPPVLAASELAASTPSAGSVAAQANQQQVADSVALLANALVSAIDVAKGPTKKNPFNRKAGTPWTPKNNEPKHKLTRKMYQHSILIDPDMETNETIDLLNEIQPGTYCGGYVKVNKRRDWGIDIDWPMRTVSQRLRLVNQFGIKDFNDALRKCIEEFKTKRRPATPELDEV